MELHLAQSSPHFGTLFVLIVYLLYDFKHVPDAHQSGTEISRINFSKDDLSMASRGCDGTLKCNIVCFIMFTLFLFFSSMGSENVQEAGQRCK